jgi:sugar lactone lactonase YvrE
MRPLHKITAIAAVAIFTTSLLTVTTQSASAASNQVSILSGQGGAGEFSNPSGVSVGFAGEVYVADTDNYAIKKIEVNGAISVFAKTTVRDDDNTSDSFCSVYVRNVNEVWASNCINTKIFRYDRNGALIRTYAVTTPFVSNCANCRDWGGGLVVDRFGGIYLSDEHNHVILRIDEFNGQTTVHAGKPGTSGNSNEGRGILNLPRGLALDSKDNLYIAELFNGLIRKVTPEGFVTTVQAGLSLPIGVAVDSSDAVYVTSEHWSGSIITKIGVGRIFDDSAKTINAKLPGAIIGQPAFSAQAGLSIDSRSGSRTNNIYISDAFNHSIKVYSPSGTFVKKFGSEDGWGVTAPGTANQIFMHPSHTFPLVDGSYLVLDNFTIRLRLHQTEPSSAHKEIRFKCDSQMERGQLLVAQRLEKRTVMQQQLVLKALKEWLCLRAHFTLPTREMAR